MASTSQSSPCSAAQAGRVLRRADPGATLLPVVLSVEDREYENPAGCCRARAILTATVPAIAPAPPQGSRSHIEASARRLKEILASAEIGATSAEAAAGRRQERHRASRGKAGESTARQSGLLVVLVQARVGL